MILYPALDLLDGQIVRLVQGDFAQTTVFDGEPAAAARAIRRAGAEYLHLVDLSGAREPGKRQLTLLKSILAATDLKVQVGGGVRSLPEIEQLLALGADRVVIGSMLVTEPASALAALKRFGPTRLTFALDVQVQDGVAIVMSHGWAQSSHLSFADAVRPFLDAGLRRVLCTDIAVDGRLVGPNLKLYADLRIRFPQLELQASGGVAELADLKALREAGTHSVIVGRALLAGHFGVKEALAQC